jgi:cell wall-associated NlpC family hydrolase
VKKKFIFWVLFCLTLLAGLYAKRKYYAPSGGLMTADKEVTRLLKNNLLQNGDLIFQTSRSAQSKAIQAATKSKYSHCGIVYQVGENFFVFEAVQPVKLTPLQQWISRGKNGHYVIKRLRNADKILTDATLKKMKTEGEKFVGKNYDLTFEWSDEKIYCSELIWKIFQRAAGIEIGKLEILGNFDLSHESVKKKIKRALRR